MEWVNKYLYRIGQVNSPDCELCGVEEDIDHLMLRCTRYNDIRAKLFNDVRKLEVGGVRIDINPRTLLGGANLDVGIQRKIVLLVYAFFKQSGRLDLL